MNDEKKVSLFLYINEGPITYTKLTCFTLVKKKKTLIIYLFIYLFQNENLDILGFGDGSNSRSNFNWRLFVDSNSKFWLVANFGFVSKFCFQNFELAVQIPKIRTRNGLHQFLCTKVNTYPTLPATLHFTIIMTPTFFLQWKKSQHIVSKTL